MDGNHKWWWIAGGALVLFLLLRRSSGTSASTPDTAAQQAAIQADAQNQAAQTAAKASVLQTYLQDATSLLATENTNAAAVSVAGLNANASENAANAQASVAQGAQRASTTNAVIGGLATLGGAVITRLGAGSSYSQPNKQPGSPSFGGLNGTYASTALGFH